VTVRACPGCGGTFLPHSDLAIIAREEGAPRSEAERQAAANAATGRAADDPGAYIRRCPICRALLRRYVYAFSSGVVVDACEDHGIWLDAGELERIEAWSEADRRGIVPKADIGTAHTSRAPDLERSKRRFDDAEFDAAAGRGGALVLAGELEAAALMRAAKAARHFQEWGTSRRASGEGSVEAMALARAHAEADTAPTEADGAVVHRAGRDIPASTGQVWPLLATITGLPRWLVGIERAVVVEGAGSSRVQELAYVNSYRVRQRVFRLAPERAIAWRDETEWLQDVEVPPWHAGAWTEISIERRSDGGCRVEIVSTQLPGDDEQARRINERALAVRGWLEASLARLASVASE